MYSSTYFIQMFNPVISTYLWQVIYSKCKWLLIHDNLSTATNVPCRLHLVDWDTKVAQWTQHYLALDLIYASTQIYCDVYSLEEPFLSLPVSWVSTYIFLKEPCQEVFVTFLSQLVIISVLLSNTACYSHQLYKGCTNSGATLTSVIVPFQSHVLDV